ncbi:Chromatin structure-remodeling complex protein rsc9 [Cryptotrichosporon argae]
MSAQVSRAPSSAVHAAAPGGPSSLAARPRPKTAYSSDVQLLHPGPRNRFFLALRSGIDSEIDWALPRLVVASHEQPDAFKLETWVDSVAALRVWPERWLEQLEREAALFLARGADNDTVRAALGAVPEWTRDAMTAQRAAECLLILRNASVSPGNAKLICRTSFADVLVRFFSLPHAFLLDLALREPEPFLHILVIFNSMIYHLFPSPTVFQIFATVLPDLVVDTRDTAILAATLPILIATLPIPSVPPPPARLVPHLLRMLVADLPANLPDLVLDLLVSLTMLPQHARMLLALPEFGGHLRTIVGWLERGARPYVVQIEAPVARQASLVPNPAGAQARAEAASRRRLAQHEADARVIAAQDGYGITRPVGIKSPALDPAMVDMLYKMTEPRRSIAWMHETFTYSSASQLLQVAFWHAYRDFFNNPACSEQMLSASEVIKNVSIAFPHAKPKVVTDEGAGERRFVIDGIGFRHATENEDLYACAWQACTESTGHSSPTALLAHVHATHLTPSPDACAWGTCTQPRPTLSHLATHIPYAASPAPSMVTVDARAPAPFADPLSRPAPYLPKAHRLRFAATLTPTDAKRQPAGAPFLAALVVRNLARTLRAEVAAAASVSAEEQASKKKAMREERYGLPIPESVLREEEKEEDEAQGKDREETGMGERERARARDAFDGVEERMLRVMGTNIVGLAQYLADALMW